MIMKPLSAGMALILCIALPQAADAQRHHTTGVQRHHERKQHRKDKKENALIGAGIGLLAGAIISNGDPWATLGGAAAGGVIGKVATDDKRRDRRWDRRGYNDRYRR